MDLRGVSVSSGSACTSGAMQPSKVLLAIGRDILTAKATIRFSFGKNTTTNDLDFALNALKDTLDAMNY
jgi:cysteine desulfurase